MVASCAQTVSKQFQFSYSMVLVGQDCAYILIYIYISCLWSELVCTVNCDKHELCHDAIYIFDSKGPDRYLVVYYLFVHLASSSISLRKLHGICLCSV